MEEAAQFLAIFIVSLIGAGISYRQSTRKGAARSRINAEKSAQLENDNRALNARLGDLEVIVKDQRIQIATLSHFQMLYETLKEAHDGLKRDHDELKAKFEARDAALQARDAALQALQADFDNKATRATDLERQNSDLFEANKQLASRVRAYEDFARLLGIQLKDQAALVREAAGEGEQADQTTIETNAEPSADRQEGTSHDQPTQES